jgi:hypothetical protein
MFFSPPTLHPPLITTDQDRDFVRSKIAALTAGRPKRAAGRIAAGTSFSIPLTTVSKLGNFDSLIDVQFSYQGGKRLRATLLADSGNSSMIIPNGEDLVGVPGYTILGTAREPWGCPANVVQGPLQIVATDGGIYRMDSCVFYACTANNSKNQRTANFGMAKINPWSASSWNTPLPKKPNVILQSPLSYGTAPYAEVIFEPATTMRACAMPTCCWSSASAWASWSLPATRCSAPSPISHGCRSCRPRSRSAARRQAGRAVSPR